MVPVTTTELLLSRIADTLDQVLVALGGEGSAPGTQDPEPPVSEAPAQPRKTAAAKAATKPTASRKGR